MRQPRLLAIAALLLLTLAGGSAISAAPATQAPPAGVSTRTALDDYIAATAGDTRWEWVKAFENPGLRTHLLRLTSQRWRTAEEVTPTTWTHWLLVNVPEKVEHETAMLFISGGSSKRGEPDKPDARTAAVALQTGSVSALLTLVPNQPTAFTGGPSDLYEDAIIAYTWDRYLAGGDDTWPLQLPMTRSAVAAMDAVQQFLASPRGGSRTIDDFVVSGASKRGWTTWLTAAADPRVSAIIPIVIDVLNVVPSMRHHRAAYGFWAPAIGDYEQADVTSQLEHPRTAELMAIVDPYSYRDRLTMPKYIVNASGDQFFLPDSWQFYYDSLSGPKYLRYVPNADHGLRETDALEGIIAFYQALLTGYPLPEYGWSANGARIEVRTGDKPRSVRYWHAVNPTARDFRLEEIGPVWKSEILAPAADGRYAVTLETPAQGWRAGFIELTFEGPGKLPLIFTTGVKVTPETLPHAETIAAGQ